MNWRYTNILHGPRLLLSLTPNDYCVLDVYYQTQSSPRYGVDGWAENTYAQVATFLGFSKGAIHAMVSRFVERGLMEVNPANPKQKRTTPAWYGVAYEDVQKMNAGRVLGEIPVQKVNADVQILNEDVQKVNADRSNIERHTEEYKVEYKGNVKGKLAGARGNRNFDLDEIADLDRQCAADALQKSSAKKGSAPSAGSGVIRPLASAALLSKSDAMDMLEIYFEGERGQQVWDRIRTGAGAGEGELIEPYLSVQAMVETIDNPEVWSVIGTAVKALPGFAAVQLTKERTARRREQLELARVESQNHQRQPHERNQRKPSRPGDDPRNPTTPVDYAAPLDFG
ncbi:hypothetical protein [Lewinella sp. JB7]|uniref:hypothetical protein n=1 Tax=Lewinella sp. JB7 TaxID=2962887 RepID=UPI0020C9E5FA|nr:hypothetical protein [Lewinella sp. JB7]MCP9237185.1 hypothetical protein [Lewinella sp. JB7]